MITIDLTQAQTLHDPLMLCLFNLLQRPERGTVLFCVRNEATALYVRRMAARAWIDAQVMIGTPDMRVLKEKVA